MRDEIIRIGLAGIIVGLAVPAVLAVVHGVATATPLLIYTIPVFISGVALLVLGGRMKAEPSGLSATPDSN